MITLNSLKANTIPKTKDFTSKHLSKKWPIVMYPHDIIGFKGYDKFRKIKELKIFSFNNVPKELCVVTDRCKVTYRGGIFLSDIKYITSIAFKSEEEFTIFALQYHIGSYSLGRRVE